MVGDAHTRAIRVRRLPLQGVVNFRDLGGYSTADGRAVRWGQVFRSDALCGLTDSDLVVLADLGLRTVCDLRSEAERAHMPNRQLLARAAAPPQVGLMACRGAGLL